MKRIVITIVSLVLLVVVAGAAFWAGTNVGHAQAQAQQNDVNSFLASRGVDTSGTGGAGATGGSGTGTGAFGGRGGAGFANRGATGTITKIEGNVITITDSQGQTLTVNITDNTPIVKSVLGAKSDLVVGGRILAAGTRSGNNVAAQGIQITDQPNGTGSLFGRGNGASHTPSPATTATPGQ
ncbi:MAG: hypothetical protein IVW55_11970 [Chloroflexi bacterium]|nr:hypothetical protein [Chloroflexota bacterium]